MGEINHISMTASFYFCIFKDSLIWDWMILSDVFDLTHFILLHKLWCAPKITNQCSVLSDPPFAILSSFHLLLIIFFHLSSCPIQPTMDVCICIVEVKICSNILSCRRVYGYSVLIENCTNVQICLLSSLCLAVKLLSLLQWTCLVGHDIPKCNFCETTSYAEAYRVSSTSITLLGMSSFSIYWPTLYAMSIFCCEYHYVKRLYINILAQIWCLAKFHKNNVKRICQTGIQQFVCLRHFVLWKGIPDEML